MSKTSTVSGIVKYIQLLASIACAVYMLIDISTLAARTVEVTIGELLRRMRVPGLAVNI